MIDCAIRWDGQYNKGREEAQGREKRGQPHADLSCHHVQSDVETPLTEGEGVTPFIASMEPRPIRRGNRGHLTAFLARLSRRVCERGRNVLLKLSGQPFSCKVILLKNRVKCCERGPGSASSVTRSRRVRRSRPIALALGPAPAPAFRCFPRRASLPGLGSPTSPDLRGDE